MGSLSITHLLLIVFILLLFFGPSKLEQLGKSLGKGIRGFKDGLNEMDGEARDISDRNPTQQINQQNQSKSEAAQPQKEETKKS